MSRRISRKNFSTPEKKSNAVIGQFLEVIDQNNGIVGSTTGSNYYVRILSTIDRELLKRLGRPAQTLECSCGHPPTRVRLEHNNVERG